LGILTLSLYVEAGHVIEGVLSFKFNHSVEGIGYQKSVSGSSRLDGAEARNAVLPGDTGRSTPDITYLGSNASTCTGGTHRGALALVGIESLFRFCYEAFLGLREWLGQGHTVTRE